MRFRDCRQKLDDYLLAQCADHVKYERLWRRMTIGCFVASIVYYRILFALLD